MEKFYLLFFEITGECYYFKFNRLFPIVKTLFLFQMFFSFLNGLNVRVSNADRFFRRLQKTKTTVEILSMSISKLCYGCLFVCFFYFYRNLIDNPEYLFSRNRFSYYCSTHRTCRLRIKLGKLNFVIFHFFEFVIGFTGEN